MKADHGLGEYFGHAAGIHPALAPHLVEDSAERTKRAVDAVFGHRVREHDPGDAAPDDDDDDV
jgi:hypothetical protein